MKNLLFERLKKYLRMSLAIGGTLLLIALFGCSNDASFTEVDTSSTTVTSAPSQVPSVTAPASTTTPPPASTTTPPPASTTTATATPALTTTPMLVPTTVKETGNRENEVAKEEVSGTSLYLGEVAFDSDDPTPFIDHSEHYQGEGDESNWDDGVGSVDIDFDANEYPRMYKDPIRGIWEPGAWDQLANFVRDTSGQERLESLGVNTISVVGSFDVLEDGEYEFPFTITFIETEIVRYKKLGFAVFLSGNSRGAPSDVDPEQALENYLLSCKMAAVELAELGERYNVEYFSPNNEFEGSLAAETFPNRFQSYNPPETPFDPIDPGTATRVEAASGWFKDILPELRQVFSGKIIAKVGEAHPTYMVEGYDYLAFTVDHHHLNKSDFRRLVREQYKDIADAAAKSGVSWMVGEAYFHYGDEGLDLDTSTKSFLKDMQQHYFDISLDEYLSFDQVPRPSGYIFIGYFMEGIEIKDSSSEAIIRNYFKLMN